MGATRLQGIVGACLLGLCVCAGPADAEWRTYDGTDNHVDPDDASVHWGSVDVQLLRRSAPAYDDGFEDPSGTDRPSTRAISNAIVAQSESIPNSFGHTDLVWGWGQFIDHDISLTEPADPAEPFNIPVPDMADPLYTPGGIPLNRSVYDADTGEAHGVPREQINQITSYIDASMVYGSSEARADALRTFSGGKLATDPVTGMLPKNTGLLHNANGNPFVADEDLPLAGDIRVAENILLTSLHTLFALEHNRLADEIALDPDVQTKADTYAGGDVDEYIYQRARKLNGAQIQKITYYDWLPQLVGDHVSDNTGYNLNADPGIENEFSNFAFRLGHSMLSDELLLIDGGGDHSYVSLADAFFNPEAVDEKSEVKAILKGAMYHTMQEIDHHIVDSVRNALFGPPGAGGMDLAAINMQRFRDHGGDDFSAVRQAYGLDPITSFADLTDDPDLAQALFDIYSTTNPVDPWNSIDPWLGAIAETPVDGLPIGLTLLTIIVDQFERLRDGDRFYFEIDPDLTSDDLAWVMGRSLEAVLTDAMGMTGMPQNVFVPEPTSLAPLLGTGLLAIRRRR